jgi:hypothetical protein
MSMREKLREWRKKLTKHMRDGHRCEFRIDCEAVVQSIDAILAEPEGEAVAIAADLAARQQPPDPEFDRLIAHNLPDFLDDTAPASTADKAWLDGARRCIERALRLLDNVTADDSGSDDLGAAENALRNALATLTAAAPQAPRPTDDELWDQTLRERDNAEKALGGMFHAVTGRTAEWSNAWGYADAIEEAAEHVAALSAPQAPVGGVERLWREAFTNERAMRYMDEGMKAEQARIHAETDAHAVLAALQQPASGEK